MEMRLMIKSTKECENNKVTNTVILKTLIWLWCIHGACAADGINQASMCSPLKFKHLSHHGIKACILAQKKQVSSFL